MADFDEELNNQMATSRLIGVQATSARYTSRSSASSVVSADTVQYTPAPSETLKAKLKRELMDELESEGLLRSKSDLKEMTEERMLRRIDSILKKAKKDE